MSTILANIDIKTSQFEPKNYTCDSNNGFPIYQYLMVGNLWTRIRGTMISCIEE